MTLEASRASDFHVGMTKRFLPIAAAVLACTSLAGTPALATDDPPPQSQPPATTQTDATDATPTAPTGAPAPDATTPVACTDTMRPRTKLRSTSKTASRRHIL